MNALLKLLSLLLIVFYLPNANPQDKNTKFDAPDQVTWHEESKTWFVSNLGGGISFAKDHYGWISRLNANGEVIDAAWVKGLNAPTGMVVTATKLFVCDRDGIVQIDIKSAKIEQMYPITGAEFINDIAIGANGDLYVSDFYGDMIYRLPATTRKAEKFLAIPNSPDGILVDGNQLIVVTWGKVTDRKTFATSKKGKVLCVDLATKTVKPLLPGVEEVGNLEGIIKAGGYYYITDWAAGKLLKVSKKTGVEVVVNGLKHPSDIGYSPSLKTLGFAEHGGNRVLFIKTGL
jgi:sugar lactone lactonase YvrE